MPLLSCVLIAFATLSVRRRGVTWTCTESSAHPRPSSVDQLSTHPIDCRDTSSHLFFVETYHLIRFLFFEAYTIPRILSLKHTPLINHRNHARWKTYSTQWSKAICAYGVFQRKSVLFTTNRRLFTRSTTEANPWKALQKFGGKVSYAENARFTCSMVFQEFYLVRSRFLLQTSDILPMSLVCSPWRK